MKKQTIFIVFIALSIYSKAQNLEEVKWYTFEEAIELNKTNPRKIFIDVYTDWCGWCKKMEKFTFTNPQISKILNKQFYAVRLNAETKEKIMFSGKEFINEGTNDKSPHQLAIALLNGKMSYPSIAYLNEKNQLLTAIPGYQTPEKLEVILNFLATDAYKTKSFQDYNKSFVSSIK
ncbi:MAG: DUF255 domain-containing protein [Bacteroidales bacterium]|jgi:thioredoxin-related protein|nr:DUF255 domain-containing protein [Bacteroidales bacterium]